MRSVAFSNRIICSAAHCSFGLNRQGLGFMYVCMYICMADKEQLMCAFVYVYMYMNEIYKCMADEGTNYMSAHL